MTDVNFTGLIRQLVARYDIINGQRRTLLLLSALISRRPVMTGFTLNPSILLQMVHPMNPSTHATIHAVWVADVLGWLMIKKLVTTSTDLYGQPSYFMPRETVDVAIKEITLMTSQTMYQCGLSTSRIKSILGTPVARQSGTPVATQRVMQSQLKPNKTKRSRVEKTCTSTSS